MKNARYLYGLLGGMLFVLLLVRLAVNPADLINSTTYEIDKDSGRADFVLAAKAAPTTFGGYASKVSVAQGESLAFHVSTNISTYDLTVWREGATRDLMMTVDNLSGDQYDCTNGYESGCNWPIAYTLQVPTSWPSGVYTVDIPISGKTDQHIIFWVREDTLSSSGSILFLSSVNTYNAYTNFGGKSLYNFNSDGDEAAEKVSFDRPFKNNGLGDYERWEGKFVSWAEEAGYDVEYATTYDLEFMPDLLDDYDVVVIAGHSEYWTWDMRQRLKAFIEAGGRFVNLSGNTMWWQVRYEDDGRTLVGYKNYSADPESTPQQVTDNSGDHPIYDNEAAITGAYFPSGGYFPAGDFTHENGYGGYSIQRSTHWVFDGVEIANDDIFGRTDVEETAIIEHEADGTRFNCASDGQTILGPLANMGTPDNFTILGIAPVYRKKIGFAVLGVYTNDNEGAVFSANSIGWSNALNDTLVDQVMRNVLNRFLDTNTPMPSEPVSSSDTDYLFYDRFNCYDLDYNWPTASEWESISELNYLDVVENDDHGYTLECGVDGSGLEMVVDDNLAPIYESQLKPNWGTTDLFYSRAYLDFSNLTMANDNRFDLMRHYFDSRTGSKTKLATLQVENQSGNIMMRYLPFGENSDWVDVPDDRPFWFETMWDRSNNQVSFWVNGVRYDQAVDLSGQPLANQAELTLLNLDSKTKGSVCIDELVYDDGRIGSLPQPIIALVSDYDIEILPGDEVVFTHTLINIGGAAADLNLTAMVDLFGWDVTITPSSVADLDPGKGVLVTVTVQTPVDAIADVEAEIVIEAKSMSDGEVRDVAVDTLTILPVLGLSLGLENVETAVSGSQVTLTHTLLNSGNITDSFSLDVAVGLSGWQASIEPAVVNNLGIGQTALVAATIQIPTSVWANTQADISINARSLTDVQVQDVAYDTITVDPVWDVSLSAGYTETAVSGTQTTLTHTLTNSGNITDTFSIDATIDLPGWELTVTMLSDDPLPPGSQTPLIITVQLPADSADGQIGMVTLVASSITDGTIQASLQDQIVVGVNEMQIFLPLIISGQ